MPNGGYDQNVFVNCPFDDDFRPILEAILFCLVDCGLSPRVSTERLDAENRLDKITTMIAESRYSIHDLSRVKAAKSGEYARLNMPFELGVDYGFRRSGGTFANKRALVIATKPYEHQIALSDIAGFDVKCHEDNYQLAIKHVRAWLSQDLQVPGPSRIVGDYTAFQEWDYERLLDEGWEEEDIRERATPDLFHAMKAWLVEGRPMTGP